ncbi:MAG: GDP-mannose 4,6-dehydratase [bacterium]
MKILVTGGAGFIGSHLVERLLERGDEIVVLDDLNDFYDPAIKKRNMATATQHRLFTFVEGDVRDAGVLEQLAGQDRKFDVIVHLAARAGVRPSLVDPILYEQVNCLGTLNILQMAKKRGIKRLVFASSSSVYGHSSTPPFREDTQVTSPMSPYAATKAACELYCSNYHHLYGISCTALRFFTVYGARQRPDLAIHKFTGMIDRGEPIPFYGDGGSARDYTYYTDIIDGVTAAVDRDLGFEIINLGESRTTRLSTLVELIEKRLGKRAKLSLQPEQPGDMKVTCADISKAVRLLGYKPTTPIEAGIERFVAWYRGQASTSR